MPGLAAALWAAIRFIGGAAWQVMLGAQGPHLPASVEGADSRVVVYLEPRAGAPRRGILAGGHRVPVFRVDTGDGCAPWWYGIHAQGWICADRVRPSALPPDAPPLPELDDGSLTPFPYGFVRSEGAPVYRRPSDVAIDYVERWLEPGYAVSVRDRRTVDGVRLYRTAGGSYVRASDVYIARPSRFRGEALAGPDDIGWTFRSSTPFWESLPGGGGARSSRSLERHTLFRFVAEHAVGGTVYLETDGGGFVRGRDVRRVEYQSPPDGVGPYDRWFDIDRNSQTLVAYEGARPVYATLVSTGRREHPTPEGVHRIAIKTVSDRMANEMPDDVEEDPYYLEDVPWVAYFAGDVALHGTYWHDGFGNRRSHGCVNLAPIDAKWVFDFARPSLPRGWWSVTPTEGDPGSVVVVR